MDTLGVSLQFFRAENFIEISLSSDHGFLAHLCGNGRMVCDRRTLTVWQSLKNGPQPLSKIAHCAGMSTEEASQVLLHLRECALVYTNDSSENSYISKVFKPRFYLPESVGNNIRLDSLSIDCPLDPGSGFNANEFQHFALHPAAAYKILPTGVVITTPMKPPAFIDKKLWRLALLLDDLETIDSASSLLGATIEAIVNAGKYLIRRGILVERGYSAKAEIEDYLKRSNLDLAMERNSRLKIETADQRYIQPVLAEFDDASLETTYCPVALVGPCHAQYLADALLKLGLRCGLHLGISGFTHPSKELSQGFRHVILHNAVRQCASIFEAIGTGRYEKSRHLVLALVSAIDRSICETRKFTTAPVTMVLPGPPVTSVARFSESFYLVMADFAKLYQQALESTKGHKAVQIVNECAVYYGHSAQMDDIASSSVHHCAWDPRAHLSGELVIDVPLQDYEKNQIHPVAPLSSAVVGRIIASLKNPIKLIIFNPEGLIWDVRANEKSLGSRSHADAWCYGLSRFFGTNEALKAARNHGIILACLTERPLEELENIWKPARSSFLLNRGDVHLYKRTVDITTSVENILNAEDAAYDVTAYVSYLPEDIKSPVQQIHGSLVQIRESLLNICLGRSELPELESPAQRTSSQSSTSPEAIQKIFFSTLAEKLGCTHDEIRATEDLRLLGLESITTLDFIQTLEDQLGMVLPQEARTEVTVFSRDSLLQAFVTAASMHHALGPHSENLFHGFTFEEWQDQTLIDVISRQLEKRPCPWIFKLRHGPAPNDASYMSWPMLYQLASGFAEQYQQRGVKPGNTITILVEHGVSLIAAHLGALLIGAKPSISAYPNDKLSVEKFLEWFPEIVSRSATTCVVCNNHLRELISTTLAQSQIELPVLSVSETRASGVNFHPHDGSKPEDAALIQHSSGTTGLKKAVELSHQAVLTQVWHLAKALKITRNDVVVSWLPLYHDMGFVAAYLMPLLVGIPCVMISPFDWVKAPGLFFEEVTNERGTLAWFPNFAYLHSARRIRAQEKAKFDLSGLRCLVNCSEPITVEAMNALIKAFAEQGLRYSSLSGSYAMAENTFAVTQTSVGSPCRVLSVDRMILEKESRIELCSDERKGVQVVSSGSVLTGTRLRIVDDIGSALPDGKVGEIVIQGDSLFSGYLNTTEEEISLLDGWFHTGDLGFLFEDELFVTGRKKDLIIIAGHNIYPHEVEELISNINGIQPGRVVAFGSYQQSEGTEALIVLAELSVSVEFTELEALRQAIREKIANVFQVIPRHVKLLEKGTLTKSTSGKISRTACKEMYLADDCKRKFPFLSFDWFAKIAELEQKLGVTPTSTCERINITARTSGREVHLHLWGTSIRSGHSPEGDVLIDIPMDIAPKLLVEREKEDVMHAYQEGRVIIKGALNRAFEAYETFAKSRESPSLIAEIAILTEPTLT